MAKKNVSTLKVQRKQYFAALARVKKFVENVDEGKITEQVFFEIECRLQNLPAIFEKFENIQTDIEILTEDEDKTDHRIVFENSYYEVQAIIKQLMAKYKNRESEKGQSTQALEQHISQSQVRLPLMNLPTFNGDYEKWLEFRDTFIALVDKNQNLPNVQKFYHLRCCLQDDVLETIKAIPISDNNYKLAWKQLTDRYEKSHLISNNHVNSILNYSKLSKESSRELRSLYNCINNNLEALRNLGAPVQHWDLLLIPIITVKLDSFTRREWEKLPVNNKKISVRELLNFLNDRCEYLEKLEIQKTIPVSSGQPKLTTSKGCSFFGPEKMANHIQSIGAKCHYCDKSHFIFKCEEFLKLGVKERLQAVKQKGLCINCLKLSHMANQCRSSKCRKCGKSHNSLLHMESKESVAPLEQAQSKESMTIATTQTQKSQTVCLSNQVILPTAIVLIADSNGKLHRCRALLDSGAMSNFITKGLCQELGVKERRIECSITDVGQTLQKTHYMTDIVFKSTKGLTFEAPFIVIDKITSELPLYTFSQDQIKIPQHIKLEDPSFIKSGPIDILLGSSIFWDLMQNGQIVIPGTMLTLQKTKLGWIVGGQSMIRNCHSQFTKHKVSCLEVTSDPLEVQLKRYWELEEVGVKNIRSSEDKFCEDLFLQTHKRDADGRFVVMIPFKSNIKQLGSSREFAIKRFKGLETRLIKNFDLYSEYVKIMTEYISMNHMREIAEDNKPEEGCYYIPHHAVIRNESVTTKTRIVFDASMPTTSGLSLNDVQYVGPSIQNDLFTILINFRLHKYMMSSDISKMYRMVKLNEAHKPYHRIFWRENPKEHLKCFELQTVTFGTASAPFLAIRCLYQLALENENTYPKASQLIKNNFYVDDLIFGSDSLDELVKLQHEITTILTSAGFFLRKWLCNESSIYDRLKIRSELDCSTLQFGDKQTKTLGIAWNTKSDHIIYSNYKFDTPPITKRIILSELSRIFDPLGLVGPILVVGKILMQRMWLVRASWDDEIDLDLTRNWSAFRTELSNIHLIQIKRRVLVEGYSELELHGFCDSSEKAYGACVYVKSKNSNGEIVSNLLCSKSRLAPLKSVSLPKLELCGAVLLARLMRKVLLNLEATSCEIHYWTDSTITLAWIRGDPSRWKTFVANRVGEIQEITNIKNWHHVSSGHNPADILSRGATVNQLINSQNWWFGPPWLAEEEYPNQDPSAKLSEIPEQRLINAVHLATIGGDIINKYSSFEKLLRITAYCLRFKHNCQSILDKRIYGDLSASELKESQNLLIKIMQTQFSQRLQQSHSQEIVAS